MRRLLIAALVVLALVAALIALAAARLDSFLDANRDWLETQAEARLGRRITFDTLRVGFHGGLAAEVTNLRIADGPSEESADILQSERAQVRLRILPALFGRYEIARIVVHHPTLTVVRTADGLNLDSATRAAAPAPPSAAPAARDRKDLGALAALIVHAITIRDGEVLLLDRTRTPPLELRIRALDLTLADVALGAPVRLDLSAAVFSADDQDVELTGTIGPLLAADAATMRSNDDVPIDLHFTAGPVAVADLRRQPALATAIPASLDDELPVELEATIKGTPAALAVDGSIAAGDVTVQVTAKVAGANIEASIRSPEGQAGALTYADFGADVSLHAGQVAVTRFTVQVLGGAYSGSAAYDPSNPTGPAFHLKSVARNLDLATLLALSSSKETPRMTGRLDADLDVQGTGTDRGTIESTLTGDVRVTVRDGILKDVNIVEQALQRLTGTPGLTNLLNEKVRRKYPGIFSSGDTRFDALRGSARIGRGRATTDDLTLATRDCSLRGSGWIGFDQRLDLAAALTVSPALTADLIASAKQVQLLSNGQGQIEIPVRLHGKAPKLKVTLDPAFVSRTLGRALESGVDSLLRGKKRGKQDPGKTPRPEVDLLKKSLDNLFRR